MLRVRELTPNEIEEFLRGQRIARLGCHAGGETYVVPVIYAYGDGAVVTVTQEGRKVAMLRENPRVCVEVDEYDADGRGSWRSVIAYGAAGELTGDEIAPARLWHGRPPDPPRRAVRKGDGTLISGCATHKSLFGMGKIRGLGMDFGAAAFYNSYWREQRSRATASNTARGAAIRQPFQSERTLN